MWTTPPGPEIRTCEEGGLRLAGLHVGFPEENLVLRGEGTGEARADLLHPLAQGRHAHAEQPGGDLGREAGPEGEHHLALAGGQLVGARERGQSAPISNTASGCSICSAWLRASFRVSVRPCFAASAIRCLAPRSSVSRE